MEILAVVKALLLENDDYKTALKGGVHIGKVDQNSQLPNLLVTMISGNNGWSHQGPVNLFDYRLRLFHRGSTAQQVSDLRKLAYAILQDYHLRPTYFEAYGIKITNIFHLNETGDYNDGAEVQRTIDDYRVVYRTTQN